MVTCYEKKKTILWHRNGKQMRYNIKYFFVSAYINMLVHYKNLTSSLYLQASLMVVVVCGVYSQIADRNPPIRSFKRTLVIIPEGNGYCITNEQLFLTNATVDQIKVRKVTYLFYTEKD